MNLQDELFSVLIGLARACTSNKKTKNTDKIIIDALKDIDNNDEQILKQWIQRVKEEKAAVAPNCALCASPCGNTDDYDMEKIWNESNNEIKELKIRLLDSLKSLSKKEEVDSENFHKGLCVVSYEWEYADLLPIVEEFCKKTA